MTRLEPADTIENIVGAHRARRHHYGRAVSAEQRVYILHSELCIESGIDLRHCGFSIALDLGIDVATWAGYEDRPVALVIDEQTGRLRPEATDELIGRLARAFGSHDGGPPRFTAEAEGDDYLFGPPPDERYRGVRGLFNGDLHLIDPTYAPRQDWIVVDAHTIEHVRPRGQR